MRLLDLLISTEPDRKAGPLGRLLRPPACLACGAADAWPCCAACLPPEPAGPGPWRLAADQIVKLSQCYPFSPEQA